MSAGSRRIMGDGPVITAANIEVVPDGPKATLAVTTNIQPLTDMEAMSVKGTLASDYFTTTYNSGCSGAGLRIVDQPDASITDVKDPFEFPKSKNGTTVKGVSKKAVNVTSLNGTILNANATGTKATKVSSRQLRNVPQPSHLC